VLGVNPASPRIATLILPEPWTYQRAPLNDPASNVLVVSATQIGKSFFAASWLLGHAWEKPSFEHPWWWCGPTYGQAMVGFQYMISFAQSAGILAEQAVRTEGVKGVRISYPVMTLINGARIEARSWDTAQNLMGTPILGGVVDEAGMLDTAAQSAISSRRSGTMGPLLYLGNPGVLTGPFRRLCHLGEEARVAGSEWAGRYSLYRWTWRDKLALIESLSPEDRARFNLPTPTDYRGFIESERATIKPEEEFRRLYEAEWTADEAAVFRGLRPPDMPAMKGPEPGHRYVAGVDIAQQTDYLVACVACEDCRAIVAMERWRGIPYPQSALRLKALSEHWRAPLVIEINGPGLGVYQDLQQKGVPVIDFTTTGQTKQEIIVGLAAALDRPDDAVPARLRLADLPPLQSELLAYRYTRLPQGTYRYSAPEGEHDDCVMAAAFACYGITHRPHAALFRHMEQLAARAREARDAKEKAN
jgi:hypothetical protein